MTLPPQLPYIAFYTGGDGPTLRMALRDAAEAQRIRLLFVDLMQNRPADVSLPAYLGIGATGCHDFILQHDPRAALFDESLYCQSGEIIWAQSWEGWSRAAALITPLARGEIGHQYFSSHISDDVLVVIACGEP